LLVLLKRREIRARGHIGEWVITISRWHLLKPAILLFEWLRKGVDFIVRRNA
jgi:hypothetical protein